MKKFFIILYVIVSVFTMAQNNDQQTILTDAKKFIIMFQNRDVDGILNVTYPAVFEKVDKETISSIFNGLFNGNDNMKMDFIVDDSMKFEVAEIQQTKEGSKFAFVTYPSKFKMTFLKDKFDEDGKKMLIAMMSSKNMKAKFIDDATIVVEKQGMMIAVNDKKTAGAWKYLNYDEENLLFSSILPAEIIAKAKDFNKKITEK